MDPVTDTEVTDTEPTGTGVTDPGSDESVLVGADGDRRRHHVAAVLVALGALVVGTWWIWPGVTGQGDDVDVLVIGDDLLTDAEKSLELRVRETGRSIEWFESSGDCAADRAALADVVADRRPDSVVAQVGSCAVDALDGTGTDVVLVVEPGVSEPVTGARVVDPERLVGRPEPGMALPCMWWEDCPTGTIEVRDESGGLTPAGADRLAVLVAAGR